MVRGEGRFVLAEATAIFVDKDSPDAGKVGRQLAERINRGTGFKLTAVPSDAAVPTNNAVLLTTRNANAALGDEGYTLVATPNGLLISATGGPGLFYGVQTLLQLLPPQIFRTAKVGEAATWAVPAVKIEDQPRFRWRGMLLDVARHFFNKEEVKGFIDLMAQHKLNTLQVHLTDDQGWRIEIKRYPKLTEIGAWRKGIGFGLDPKNGTAYGPDGRYGGYFTHDDIRELVQYAKDRYVTIVPDIGMPRHSSAALTACPEFSCTGQPGHIEQEAGVFHGVYCAGNNATLEFLGNVLERSAKFFRAKWLWSAQMKCRERTGRSAKNVRLASAAKGSRMRTDCSYEPTPEYRVLLERSVRKLLATQDPDGYIGTRKPEHHLKGWDVWGRKYVLLGLIAGYDLTGNKTLLDAARRHTDSLIAECGPGKANIAALGYPQFQGLPPSSVLEPVVLLYRRTGEPRYLEFAQHIVGQWSKPNALSPHGLRLIEDALAGKSVTQIGFPKAYEMTSCFEGLCELYRLTGEKKYLQACINVANSIRQDELTVIGSGSSNEFWSGGRMKQTENIFRPMETCVTATWMKFCYQLLRLTGDSQYADELETSLYNALLGAMLPDGHWWTYFSGLSGERVPSFIQHANIADPSCCGTSCCVLNGPRAVLLTSAWAVMADANGPVVNLYGRSTANLRLPSGNRMRLVQDTYYPAGAAVMIRVELDTSESFTLALRIPAWSEQTSLLVNGREAGCHSEARRLCQDQPDLGAGRYGGTDARSAR